MDLKLAGKVVLITGSSRGIGLATAKAFAAEGCRIMLSARSAEQLREAETALRQSGAEVAAHATDVSDPDEAARLIDAAVNAYGGMRFVGLREHAAEAASATATPVFSACFGESLSSD